MLRSSDSRRMEMRAFCESLSLGRGKLLAEAAWRLVRSSHANIPIRTIRAKDLQKLIYLRCIEHKELDERIRSSNLVFRARRCCCCRWIRNPDSGAAVWVANAHRSVRNKEDIAESARSSWMTACELAVADSLLLWQAADASVSRN